MTSWIIGYLMSWVILTVLGGIAEYQYLGSAAVNRLQILMTGPHFSSSVDIIGNVTGFISYGLNWIDNLWNMMWFNYPFLTGEMLIFKYIFITISIGIGLVLAVNIFRGTSSS